MNCYDCATIQVTSVATAICLQCGVAVCPTHVYTRYVPPLPSGMAGAGRPERRERFCHTCFQGCNNKGFARHTQINTKLPDSLAFLIHPTNDMAQWGQRNTDEPLPTYYNQDNEPLDELVAVKIADALVRSKPVISTPRNSWKQKVDNLFNQFLKPKKPLLD